jgi:hypothetical protein
VHPANAPVARPEKELKRFAKVELAPGEYDLLIGCASHQIALRTKVTLQ